jgi:ABC-type multidrug transport system fused ATPase/permease subunit
LAENIAYGKRGVSTGEIKKAAELAHCDEFIKDLLLDLMHLMHMDKYVIPRC